MTGTLPPLHATFLENLIATLRRDGRFEALLAGGSLVHGGFDVHSDLDLVLVVRHEHHEAVMAGRRTFADGIGALISAFTGEHVGEPRLLICLYGPELLHVDLKFVCLSDLDHLVERPTVLWAENPDGIAATLGRASIEWPDRSPEWFEARIWTWLHYGAVKLQRGELFEAIGMLGFISEQVLGPMLHRRAGRPQRGVRRIEDDGPATAALRPLVARHDRESVAKALNQATRLYLDLRNDQPPRPTTPGFPELLLPLLTVG
ncbi:nucleotidyltransferase domain-containing protein [Oceanibacterium hippocampi]